MIARGLFLLAIVLLMSNCRRDAEAVSFAVFGDPAEFAAYQQLVDAFHEAHPGVLVELRHTPSQAEYRQRLATEFSAGRPPDVMLLNYRRFAQFASQDVLEPLGPRLASSQLLDADQFFPIALDSFRYNGHLWCIPQNISSLVVYYNKDLFDAAGLSYPAGDWDRDSFMAAARTLTRDFDGDGRIDQYGAGITPALFRVAPFLWQDGASLVDDPANPTKLALDDPAALATLTWFVNLQLEERVVPSAVAESAESSERRFLNGRLAMYFNSRRGVPTYRTIEEFEWDVAALPQGTRPAGILHSDGYCLSAEAGGKDDAWRFIEYANSATGQGIVAASGRTVPSLRDVAYSENFLQPGRPPLSSTVFVDNVPFLQQVPILPGWVSVEQISDREIERAFYGRATIETAVATAISLTEQYFRQE